MGDNIFIGDNIIEEIKSPKKVQKLGQKMNEFIKRVQNLNEISFENITEEFADCFKDYLSDENLSKFKKFKSKLKITPSHTNKILQNMLCELLKFHNNKSCTDQKNINSYLEVFNLDKHKKFRTIRKAAISNTQIQNKIKIVRTEIGKKLYDNVKKEKIKNKIEKNKKDVFRFADEFINDIKRNEFITHIQITKLFYNNFKGCIDGKDDIEINDIIRKIYEKLRGFNCENISSEVNNKYAETFNLKNLKEEYSNKFNEIYNSVHQKLCSGNYSLTIHKIKHANILSKLINNMKWSNNYFSVCGHIEQTWFKTLNVDKDIEFVKQSLKSEFLKEFSEASEKKLLFNWSNTVKCIDNSLKNSVYQNLECANEFEKFKNAVRKELDSVFKKTDTALEGLAKAFNKKLIELKNNLLKNNNFENKYSIVTSLFKEAFEYLIEHDSVVTGNSLKVLYEKIEKFNNKKVIELNNNKYVEKFTNVIDIKNFNEYPKFYDKIQECIELIKEILNIMLKTLTSK